MAVCFCQSCFALWLIGVCEQKTGHVCFSADSYCFRRSGVTALIDRICGSGPKGCFMN